MDMCLTPAYARYHARQDSVERNAGSLAGRENPLSEADEGIVINP